MNVSVEISIAEFSDKLTVLEIKKIDFGCSETS